MSCALPRMWLTPGLTPVAELPIHSPALPPSHPCSLIPPHQFAEWHWKFWGMAFLIWLEIRFSSGFRVFCLGWFSSPITDLTWAGARTELTQGMEFKTHEKTTCLCKQGQGADKISWLQPGQVHFPCSASVCQCADGTAAAEVHDCRRRHSLREPSCRQAWAWTLFFLWRNVKSELLWMGREDHLDFLQTWSQTHQDFFPSVQKPVEEIQNISVVKQKAALTHLQSELLFRCCPYPGRKSTMVFSPLPPAQQVFKETHTQDQNFVLQRAWWFESSWHFMSSQK